MTDIVFRIIGDAGGVDQAFDRVDKTLDRVQQRTQVGAKGFEQLAKQTALTRQESLALSYTMSDVAASLASGASPFTILLQQGGQVKDSFGGIGPLFSKLTGLITPARVAIGGLVAGVGAFLFAAYQGQQQSEALGRAVQLTGNYAGVTGANFDKMAGKVSEAARSTIGSAKSVLQALVTTGTVGAKSIDAIATAALLYAKASGQSADEVAKDFASMTGGVTKWAAEHNKQLHYLTLAQYQYIRQLESQGKTEEAAKVNAEALTKALKDRKPELSSIGVIYEQLARLASQAWDAMAGIGKAEGIEDKMSRVRAALEREREALEFAQSRGGSKAEITSRQATIASYEAQIEVMRLAAKTTGQFTQDRINEGKKIVQDSEANQAALIGLERAGFEKRQAQAELHRDQELIGLQRSYDEQQIQLGNYIKTKIFLERQAIDAKEAAVNEEIKLEKMRPISDPVQGTQQQARIIELETRRVGVMRERAALAERIRRNEIQPGGADTRQPSTPNQDFRAREISETDAINEAFKQRGEAALNAAHELIDINRNLSLDLILDDRTRGEALIALDEEAMKRRLDLASLGTQERERVEEDFAQWRVLREQQLTEQLKPEWQRMLEGWQDTNRLMRDASNEFMTGFVDQGEQAFVQWGTTGKLNTASLVNFIQSEFLKLAYKKYLSQSFSSFGESLFSSFTSAFTGGGLSIDTGGIGLTTGGPGLVDLGLGGGRAGGGRVSPYTEYLVGEEGPERLRMGAQGGYIDNNKSLGGGAKEPSMVVNQTVNAGVTRNDLALALGAFRRQILGEVALKRRNNPQGGL